MPSRTFTAREKKSLPGFPVSKDRLTLLWVIAVGDFKWKLMLIYHSENGGALKSYTKSTLPVLNK